MGIVERFLLNQEEIVQNFKSAEIAFSIQNYDSAELICKQILADNPKDPNALHLLGRLCNRRGQRQQAINLIQASIQGDSSNPLSLLDLGKIYGACGQFERAIGVLKESLSINQRIPETWFVIGGCFGFSGQNKKAVLAYRNVLKLDPSSRGF